MLLYASHVCEVYLGNETYCASIQERRLEHIEFYRDCDPSGRIKLQRKETQSLRSTNTARLARISTRATWC